MHIVFLIFFIAASELTHTLAVHQKQGLCRHISVGWLCWLNRIILIVPCIWYCGLIMGIILFVFTLFDLMHAAIGWILYFPFCFIRDFETILKIVEIESCLLVPLNIASLIFTIISFFVSEYRCLYDFIYNNDLFIVAAIILIFGYLVRTILFIILKPKLEKTSKDAAYKFAEDNFSEDINPKDN